MKSDYRIQNDCQYYQRKNKFKVLFERGFGQKNPEKRKRYYYQKNISDPEHKVIRHVVIPLPYL